MKKINKKQKKVLLISAVIVGIIIFSIIGFSSLSIIANASRMSCPDSGEKEYTNCQMIGNAGIDLVNEKYNLRATEPSSVDAQANVLCNKLEFLANGECTRIKNDRDLHAPAWDSLPRSAQISYITDGFIRLFGQQLISVKGTYTDINENIQEFQFYGLCSEAGFNSCIVNAQEIEVSHSVSSSSLIYATNTTIYYKLGGYTESDIPVTYYRMINNQCQKFYLTSSEITTFDYISLSTCENKIIHTYSRLQDNNCVVINIPLGEKTEFDYESYSECQANINIEELIINAFEEITGETPTQEEVTEIIEEINNQNISTSEGIKELVQEIILAKEEGKSILILIIVGVLVAIGITITGIVFYKKFLKK